MNKLNKYLESLKNDDDHKDGSINLDEKIQRIEGEVCQMLESKPLKNTLT